MSVAVLLFGSSTNLGDLFCEAIVLFCEIAHLGHRAHTDFIVARVSGYAIEGSAKRPKHCVRMVSEIHRVHPEVKESSFLDTPA